MEKIKTSRRDIQFYSKKKQALITVHTHRARSSAERLEDDDNVSLYRACEPLVYEHFELVSPLNIRKEYWPAADGSGVHWETDFYIEFADGRRAVREIADRKEFKSAVVEQLELSRRYWAAQGIDDWKVVIFAGAADDEGDSDDVCEA